MMRLIMILIITCVCNIMQAQVNIITTIAGTDSAGFSGDGGLATNAKLNVPEYLCLDKFGNVYIADGTNNRVRKVVISTGIITTIAGSGVSGGPGSFSGDGGVATNATLNLLCAVFTDTLGNLYIADAGNNRIRKVMVATGIITTVAGSGPTGVGMGGNSGDGGDATNAQMNLPVGVCLDKVGNIYIADYLNNKIRKVNATNGIITTFAGTGLTGYTGDGLSATNATFHGPIQVFADTMGNVFICDQWNHAIRRVDAYSGIITTIAGNGTAGHTGDGGLAMYSQLNQPCGMHVDKNGNIYIAEYGGGYIRKIDGATGIISTIAGTGINGFSGDGGPAIAAQTNCGDVHVDKNGIIYIADGYNNRIRMVYNDKLEINNVQMSKYADVQIYPNPAQDNITIEGAKSSDIVMYDITGREVKAFNCGINKEVVDVSDLVSGVYIIQINDSSGYKIEKRLVVAR